MGLDLTNPPKPPPASKPARATRMASGKKSSREEAANGLFQIASFGCLMGGLHADAGAFATHGPKIASEAASLAESDENVAKVLDYLTQTGPYTGLIVVCMPLVFQILANHRMIAADKLSNIGVIKPETLTAQVRAEQAKGELLAVQAQQEAERELAQAKAEMASSNGQHSKVPVKA